ncbi:MAG TPA: YfhO family protein [Verrucomicrobiae bacterium]|nr:YfhO family protein [Verrucomicrobiae bacterium]
MQSETENPFNKWFKPLPFGILLALLVFATFPQVILGLQTFIVRDFGFFVYPLAHFQRECFWRGEIPFWNPYNYCGVPFLAQWNTMPLYPPSLIYLTLPLEWSLSFFCLLHLWFAGLGMYFLARKWTVNNFAAAFAGTVFSFNGFTLNLIMWPSHLATFSWMPWVVLAVELAWREGGRKIILAAFVGAMQMLAGGPEIIFFTWILLLALWIQQFVKSESSRRKMFWGFPLVVALVVALTAIQLLPFLDLVAHSQRSTDYIDTRWSLPLRGWANFLVPMAFGGTWDMGVFYQYGQEWTSSYYLGVGALWLALLSLWKIRERRVALLVAIAFVALIFALGENTFVYPALRKIVPQLRLITHSIKFLAIVIFIAPLLAAFAIAQLQNLKDEQKLALRKRFAVVGIILLALIAAILFWAWRFPFPTDDVHRTLLNGISRVIFLVTSGAVLFFLLQNSRPALLRLAPLFLIVVAWLDVFTHEPVQNPTAPPSIYEPNLSREKLALQPQPALGGSRAMLTPRAFAASLHFATSDLDKNYLVNRLSYFSDCNLLDEVPKTDGFLSLCPREADDVNTLLYDSTNDFPRLDDFMGVSQISDAKKIYEWQSRKTFLPLVTAGQKPYFFDDFSALHALSQSNFYGGKLVIVPEDATNIVTVTNQTVARILDSKFGTQRVDIEAEAQQPSLVVISQSWYHDWRVYVDEKPATLLRANYAFQAVQIPAGRHHIRLVYEDRAFQTGAAISIPAWLGCLACLLLFKIRRN